MDIPSIFEEWNLPLRHLGRRVLVFDRIDSTNTQALALANDPTNDGLVILAREQTYGRGQHGRIWHAPAGSSVLLSVLFFPPPELRRPPLLTAWAAVSVCQFIQQVTKHQATIKWPNDVLLADQKICGILIEQRTVGARLATVAGIGLNLNQTKETFMAAGLPDATSLAATTGTPHDWQTSARQLIHGLDAQYHALLQGDSATLLTCWKEGLRLLGKNVTVELHDQEIQGRLRALTFAAVDLEISGGVILHLAPEKIRHLSH